MAIALQSAELIQPLGELSCDFFPDNDLNDKISGWLTQAKAKVTANSAIKAENQVEAARQWVYYLAYSYVAGRFAAMPNSVSVNAGADSVSYGQDRPAYWNTRAVNALAAYNQTFTERKDSNTFYTGAIPFKVVY